MIKEYTIEYGPTADRVRAQELIASIYAARKTYESSEIKVISAEQNSRKTSTVFFLLAVICAVGCLVCSKIAPENGFSTSLLLGLATALVLLGAMFRYANRSSKKQMEKALSETAYGGMLVIDQTAITDVADDGTVLRKPWETFESCFITDEIIVIFFVGGLNVIYIPYTEAAAKTLRSAFTQMEKSDKLFERKIRK